ncbi:MAG: phosphonate C-P lyase system protein PhnH [Desulfosarcina sp.]|nr:phosphonate C-P lyase system protein PhnH [Desulfosarcina sp.]MBC2742717.1 phosphonate C-P lyase system protein PhnH [Desulfosarcina sp.]MBC2765627.1 phosphonate C-P lyase system protein PhnH [Desulfosarcina sp.]
MVFPIDLNRLTPGFSDPVQGSRQTFRAILDAMAHPGRIVATDNNVLSPPRPLNLASVAVCLTLLDFETTLWTDLKPNAKGNGWLRFHCGCSIVQDPSEAVFALITRSDTMPALNKFKPGNDESPEFSTTLIIQTGRLRSTDGKRLTGPGIETFSTLKAQGLTKRFWQDRQSQSAMFPLGVDIIFTCENRLAALPRTSSVEG